MRKRQKYSKHEFYKHEFIKSIITKLNINSVNVCVDLFIVNHTRLDMKHRAGLNDTVLTENTICVKLGNHPLQHTFTHPYTLLLILIRNIIRI